MCCTDRNITVTLASRFPKKLSLWPSIFLVHKYKSYSNCVVLLFQFNKILKHTCSNESDFTGQKEFVTNTCRPTCMHGTWKLETYGLTTRSTVVCLAWKSDVSFQLQTLSLWNRQIYKYTNEWRISPKKDPFSQMINISGEVVPYTKLNNFKDPLSS